MFHNGIWLAKQFSLMYSTDSFLDSLWSWCDCFLSKTRNIPDSDSLIQRGRSNKIFAWMEASTHDIMIMARQNTMSRNRRRKNRRFKTYISTCAMLPLSYKAKNMQVAQVYWHCLFTTCYNKPMLGCIRTACDSLVTTSLLQVVNRLVSSWLSKLVIHRLAASCFTKL